METERAAAKRRASFARAERVAKGAKQRTEQTKTEQRRAAERVKADQQRRTDAVKAAEQRNALARKRAEQRRLERHQANLKQEFSRKAADHCAREARADQQRQAEAAKVAGQKQLVERDPKRREAEAHVAQQQKRHLRDQQDEHRRQTDRLRAEHVSQCEGARHREAAAIIEHARQVRNVDIAERRELEALDEQRRGLGGRVIGLVRGSKHFARQEQAIADRHESARWQKHRDHETRKDNLFWTEQARRLGRASERMEMAKTHKAERQELAQAHQRSRPSHVQHHIWALDRLQRIPVERPRVQQFGVTPVFEQAAGRELKR